jgi:hypothetical protein
MVIAETLAGLSLINASVKAIKGVIGTCKDVGEIADQIDSVFKGTKEVKKSSHPIASRWDSLLGKTLGSTADKFSLGAIAKDTIEEKLAAEQILKVKRMVNLRFGGSTWDDILEERRIRIEKHKVLMSKASQKKEEANAKLLKILETIAGYIFVIAVIGGVGAYIWWARK